MTRRFAILFVQFVMSVGCASASDEIGDSESSTGPTSSSASADETSAELTSGGQTSAGDDVTTAPESGSDTTSPELCGNGIVDAAEACDGGSCCTDDCTFVAAGAPVVLPAVAMGEGGTYPRATRLANGDLFGVYERYDGATDRLVLDSVTSSDGAQEWLPLSELAGEPATPGRTLGNPHAVQLADGTVLVAFRHHDPAAVGVNYRLLVTASGDLGATWAFRGEIETFTSTSVGIWEPLLFVTPAGTLQVYYAKERDGGAAQDIVVRSSNDAGATWAGERVVATAAGSRDGMPGVATLSDDSIIAVLESFREPGANNHFVVRSVASIDDGVTWQDRRIVFEPADPQRNAGAPQVVTLADGRIAVSFMTDDGATARDWPHGAATMIVVSENVPTFGDVVWSAPIVVAPASSYWPGLADAATPDALVLFDAGGVRSTWACLPE